MPHLTVSQLARRVGATADTVRFYERIGLLPPPARSPAGYRLFTEDDAERVAFIRRAQRFGLTLDAIRELVQVRDRGLCACGHARELLAQRLGELDEQITALAQLREDVRAFVDEPRRDDGGCWPCEPQLVQITTTRRTR